MVTRVSQSTRFAAGGPGLISVLSRIAGGGVTHLAL